MEWCDCRLKPIMIVGGIMIVIGVFAIFILDLISEGLNRMNKDTIAVSEAGLFAQLFIGAGIVVFICGVVIKLKCWKS